MKVCPECNGDELEFISGDFGTGVFAPDGYEERLHEEGYRCVTCDRIFDLSDLEDESEYHCEVGEDSETNCRRIGVKVYREPFTPGRFAVIACDEHADGLRSSGYHFDEEATIQLNRDIEREKEMEAHYV